MKRIGEVFQEVAKLSDSISRVLEKADYHRFDDLSGLDINYDDLDERFLQGELRSILYRLDKVNREIEYLKRPIIGEYILRKNEDDRYECDVREFYSGSTIECFVYDEFDARDKWVITRVEHNSEDYYLVDFETTDLEGLKIRVREYLLK